MHLIGQKHGQRVKALSNSFVAFNVHGMTSKNKLEKTTYCSYLMVA